METNKKLIKALKKVVVSEKSFDHALEVFFKGYVFGLEDLANDIFEATGAIDFTEARKQIIIKNATKLLDDFIDYHNDKYAEFIYLLKEYNQFQKVESKEKIKDKIKIFKFNIRQILKIYNVRATSQIEYLEEEKLDFSRLDSLKKLANLTYEDLEEFWSREDAKFPIT